MGTLIKNGRIVTAVDDYAADSLIDGETIPIIGKTIDMEADVVIDALGKLVIHGGIDPHTIWNCRLGGLLRRTIFLCERGRRRLRPFENEFHNERYSRKPINLTRIEKGMD